MPVIILQNRIARVFNNTVATYKYFWLLSILDILVKEGKTTAPFTEIITHMIAKAWYPVHYFKLSFGQSDSQKTLMNQIGETAGQSVLHLQWIPLYARNVEKPGRGFGGGDTEKEK